MFTLRMECSLVALILTLAASAAAAAPAKREAALGIAPRGR
jgi:hypothetical protein